MNNHASQSDAFVLFGATGDLAYKKIFPALHWMIKRGNPGFPIIGVSRGGSGLEQLRQRVQESVKEYGGGADPRAIEILTKNLSYVDGDYRTEELFRKLRETLGGAKRPLYYLSIPPSVFPQVVELLGKTRCSDGARVVVEKPFGRDLA
ncbi:MAG TPA: glucose-6-phosphate dehydrogenase, partial [Polyangiaceae bacterium]|nr:glucose-6-phosphate dehydrogenase [Polyangiaceae bacterium]